MKQIAMLWTACGEGQRLGVEGSYSCKELISVNDVNELGSKAWTPNESTAGQPFVRPEQKTQLSHVQTSDTQKLWDNNGYYFKPLNLW